MSKSWQLAAEYFFSKVSISPCWHGKLGRKIYSDDVDCLLKNSANNWMTWVLYHSFHQNKIQHTLVYLGFWTCWWICAKSLANQQLNATNNSVMNINIITKNTNFNIDPHYQYCLASDVCINLWLYEAMRLFDMLQIAAKSHSI